MAELLQKSRSTNVKHLKNIFATGELDENSVCRKYCISGSACAFMYGFRLFSARLISGH
jgi:hypothetical protein